MRWCALGEVMACCVLFGPDRARSVPVSDPEHEQLKDGRQSGRNASSGSSAMKFLRWCDRWQAGPMTFEKDLSCIEIRQAGPGHEDQAVPSDADPDQVRQIRA